MFKNAKRHVENVTGLAWNRISHMMKVAYSLYGAKCILLFSVEVYVVRMVLLFINRFLQRFSIRWEAMREKKYDFLWN